MRILALETSGNSGSVAALEGDRLIADAVLPPEQRSAQALAPAIDALLARVDWQPRQIELVAVTSGPGSFTGLRIGVSTAKALAYAAETQIIGVNTLEAIAHQVPAEVACAGNSPSGSISVVIDAQRMQLFVATFCHSPAGRIEYQSPTAVVDHQGWLAGLKTGDLVTGPGLKRWADRLPAGVIAVEPGLWWPTAAAVGRLGYEQFTAGRRDDVFQLVPQYFRRTAAEEQWERLHGESG
jgi:tRNA threonylcarbamoyladenosine biosynthesis protein TsaB